MSEKVDIAIVGGGIVGLATSVALSESNPRLRIAVLEKEPAVSAHQSGNNTGVIHAGIYYKPGSLKAKLCVEGARLMTEFCQAHAVPYDVCGKVVVATQEIELPRLQAIYERAVANGVEGVRVLSAEELREREPHCFGLKALLCPPTGIVDYPQACRAMVALVQSRGVEVKTGARVLGIQKGPDGLTLETAAGPVHARHMINCGGLYSDMIARMMGVKPPVRIIPFRGEFFQLRKESLGLVRGLIYPVPDPALPFIGVHFTRMIHGGVEAGPNAVLALAREGYSLGKVNFGEVMAMLGYPGFWRMAATHWKTGLYEMYRSMSKDAFVRSLQRFIPELTHADLEPGGAGVRAQAVAPTGALVDDFSITVIDGAIHVLNAPSPAATASLAIGRHIARLTVETFGALG